MNGMVQQMAVQSAQNSANTAAQASHVIAAGATKSTMLGAAGTAVGVKLAIAAIIIAIAAGLGATTGVLVGRGHGASEMPSSAPSFAPGGGNGIDDDEFDGGRGGGRPDESLAPTSSPTPEPLCAQVLQNRTGRLDVRLTEIANYELSELNLVFLADLMQMVYNSAPNRCNEIFERVMTNATISSWKVVEPLQAAPYVELVFNPTVQCDKCLSEEPLFALGLRRRSNEIQDQDQYALSLKVIADQYNRELKRMGVGRVVGMETRSTVTNRRIETVEVEKPNADDFLRTKTPTLAPPTLAPALAPGAGNGFGLSSVGT
jgi:hypothetical protein